MSRRNGRGCSIRAGGVFRGLWVAICLVAGAAWASDAPEADLTWHVVPMEKASKRAAVPLPPLAVVTSDDSSGKTWQQSGRLSGALERALLDFKQSLRGGGWTQEQVVSMGGEAGRSELAIWTTSRHRILLMVWEEEPGQCGFAWGQER